MAKASPGDTLHTTLTLATGSPTATGATPSPLRQRRPGHARRDPHRGARQRRRQPRPSRPSPLKQPPLTYRLGADPARASRAPWRCASTTCAGTSADSLADLGPADRGYVTAHRRRRSRPPSSSATASAARACPPGSENVRATYRTGIGKAGNVDAGQISQLATRPLGVKGVINPLPRPAAPTATAAIRRARNAPLAVTGARPPGLGAGLRGLRPYLRRHRQGERDPPRRTGARSSSTSPSPASTTSPSTRPPTSTATSSGRCGASATRSSRCSSPCASAASSSSSAGVRIAAGLPLGGRGARDPRRPARRPSASSAASSARTWCSSEVSRGDPGGARRRPTSTSTSSRSSDPEDFAACSSTAARSRGRTLPAPRLRAQLARVGRAPARSCRRSSLYLTPEVPDTLILKERKRMSGPFTSGRRTASTSCCPRSIACATPSWASRCASCCGSSPSRSTSSRTTSPSSTTTGSSRPARTGWCPTSAIWSATGRSTRRASPARSTTPAGQRRNRILIPRREVANTMRSRRRKGTLALLELLAADVAGWPARAVEFYKLLACHPARSTTCGSTAAAPSTCATARPWTASAGPSTIAHTVDVRRVTSRRTPGRPNLPSVALFVWRLRAYPVTRTPAYCAEDVAPHLLHLQRPRQRRAAVRSSRRRRPSPTAIARRARTCPVPIRRRAFAARKEDFYGPGKSVQIVRVALQGPQQEVVRQPVPVGEIVAADLTDWQYVPRRGRWRSIPVLGRIAFPPRHPPRHGIRVSYHYGFSADIGGGEYDRAAVAAGGRHRLPGRGARGAEAGSNARAGAPAPGSARAMPSSRSTDSGVYVEQIKLELARGRDLAAPRRAAHAAGDPPARLADLAAPTR